MLNRFDSAVYYFKNAYSLDPNDINTNLNYANSLYRHGDLISAATILYKTHPVDSMNEGRLFVLLGHIHFDKYSYDSSQFYFTKAFHRDTVNTEIQNCLALTAISQGKLDDALRWINMALSYDRLNSRYLTILGLVEYLRSNYTKSIEILNSPSIGSDNGMAFYLLSMNYFSLNCKKLGRKYRKLSGEHEYKPGPWLITVLNQ